MKNTIITSLAIALLLPFSSLLSAEFNMNGLGNDLNGWKKKNHTAAEYKSADSNYRTYKPTVTPTDGGGLFISTKIDHIRGRGGDDHCQLEMTFDGSGKIVSSSATIKMGDKSFNTKIVTESAALAGASAGTSAAIAIGVEISKLLQSQISSWNEHGGRANFPAVVKHNFNLISKNVKR